MLLYGSYTLSILGSARESMWRQFGFIQFIRLADVGCACAMCSGEHVWYESMCGMRACVLWEHVWCGSMCDVGACVVWEHVWCGSMCGVGPCVMWEHVWCGSMCGVGACVGWEHV